VRIKRALGCIVISIAASTALAEEPTSLAQVKTIILRFGEAASATDTILTEIESRLSKLGMGVTGNETDADAEMVITGSDSTRWSFSMYGGGSRHQIQVGVRVLSLPSKHVLFSATGGAANDEIDDACKATAKKIIKKLEDARD
jgi:hypothetical protein